MFSYLTSLAAHYLRPLPTTTTPSPSTSNPNALSLAAIASHTDHKTTTTNSFFSPEEQQPPTKTTTTRPPAPNTLSPRATHDLISRLETTSPLLPQNLANFITAASLATRVSLRSSAFFIELILESLRYSTTTSLSITRRALISAVGSARAIHYNTTTTTTNNNNNNNNPYLNVLDHYTNVGIYLVHHVFTMAELLSIAGLDLTHSVISTGFETAEVSVMMLDSIFGSNESSRALSAIIMLVRRELLHDPRFTPSHSSSLTGLVALTKAITAFACLQLATTRRTTGSMKMRVVWDATMVAESLSESRSLAGGGIDYQLGIKQGRAHGCHPSQQEAPPSPPRGSIHKLSDSLSSTTMSARATRTNSSTLSSASAGSQAPAQHRLDEREEIEFELTQILTDGENSSYRHHPADPTPNSAEKQVSEDVRKALYHVKRTSYSRTQSYSSGLASLATTLPDSSSSTYQLTTLTTQTTRTRTTTTSTTHSSSSSSSNPADNNNTTTTTNDGSSPKPSYEAYQVHWSANLDPPGRRPSKMRIITKSIQPSNDQSEEHSPPTSPKPSSSSKAKSMPSSPQRSLFFSQPKLVRRSLTRSKTHSDINDLLLLDDPYSFAYPIPPSQQTPPSSPSVISEESSLESDEPHQRPVSSFPSTISEIPQEDEDGYFGRPVAPPPPPPPSFTSPQQSSTSVQTIRTHRVSQTLSSPAAQPPSSDFPPQSLVKNLSRFMRYSSAAYGQQFLRIMGIGVDSFNYPNTKKHSANDHAFASHVGLAVDQILLSSFTEPNPVLGNEALSPLVHYVSIDHESKAVVLTCRGTLGLSDILVDLTCEYEPISVDGGDPNASYLAHSGMLHSALRLRRESSTVHEVIKQALLDYPSYGLIITGHSLGGGVAALLAVLCSTRTESFLAQTAGQQTVHPPISTRFVTSFRSGFPPGRPIHSYTYGTPAVASLDLSEYTKGLVTTVANGIDIVPTLSLGVLHDLKSIAVSLHEEESVAIEIVKKVVGLYRPQAAPSAPHQQAQNLFDSQPQQQQQQGGRGGGGRETERGPLGLRDPQRRRRQQGRRPRIHRPGARGLRLWEGRACARARRLAVRRGRPPRRPSGAAPSVSPSSRAVSSSSALPFLSAHPAPPGGASSTTSRREGRRIILRACDDVQARFCEPIFGKTMFHDHIPSQYELVLELLDAATDAPACAPSPRPSPSCSPSSPSAAAEPS
ncbi:hypothetical protein PTTG_28188 [Puccinia triticina 1-1 BBBD Race 1]|uniref:sn-1-specific diacylglycerol lipase n=1 Tax=Puccinia triticina (isolate 1-1 / race 1 (BBBD)) TaxID=630390 RepID=A0A180GFW7_PUCT1|nr:hypothetical protein PTTG_28188 [Puccinia triticina 1-1 BBBD Race 1]